MDEELRLLHALHLPSSATMWVGAIFVFYIVSRVSVETSKNIEKIFGPLGRKWAKARDERIASATESQRLSDEVRFQKAIIDAKDKEIALLKIAANDRKVVLDQRRQIIQLDAALRELRRYGEITYAYILYDNNWHRTDNLMIDPDAPGRKIHPHISYLDFEDQYHRNHGTQPYDPLAPLAGFSALSKKEESSE